MCPHLSRPLPHELRAYLSDARSPVTRHRAKLAAGVVANRILELSVVEDVEKFSPDQERRRFSDPGILRQPEVSVYQTWAIEKSAVGGADCSQGRVGER